MVGCGAALEHRFELERPGLVDDFPIRIGRDGPAGGFEISGDVRPEMQMALLTRVSGEQRQKLRFHNPMLVMPLLGPWIGEKDESVADAGMPRQRLEEKPGFGVNEREVVQLCAITFAQRAFHPLADDVHADAAVRRMSPCICGKEMAVTGAHFPYEFRRCRKQARQLFPQIPTPMID